MSIQLVLPPRLANELERELAFQRDGSGDGGNCFTVCLLVSAGLENSEICHGLPVGNGPINNGKKYWHGWVETQTPQGPMVLDFSNGHRLAVKRVKYYRLGQIKYDEVFRFQRSDVPDMLEHYQRPGPWVDGFEEMGL